MSTFMSLAATAEQGEKALLVRQSMEATLAVLEKYCPAGRELSLAKTKLEESCMWAIKGITHNG